MVLLIGPDFLLYLPVPMLGGLLAFLGLDLLVEWLIKSRNKLPWRDYLIIIGGLLSVIAFGLIQAVMIGVIISLVLFVLSYSRISVVKHALEGIACPSHVERNPDEKEILLAMSPKVHVLILHGYIFFGTSDKLFEQIHQRINQENKTPLEFIVLDFSHVERLDSSAVFSLKKIHRTIHTAEITLIYTGLGSNLNTQMTHMEVMDDFESKDFLCIEDLNKGMAWCEDQLLTAHHKKHRELSLAETLSHGEKSAESFDQLQSYLKRITLQPKDKLFHQGDYADSLYLIESGELNAYISKKNGDQFLVSNMRSGTIIGEIGLYAKTNRMATIVAESEVVLYQLNHAEFRRMHVENPETAYWLHTVVMSIIYHRLETKNRQIISLS